MVSASRPPSFVRTGQLVAAALWLGACAGPAGQESDAGRQRDVLRPPVECDATAPTSCPDPMPRWPDVQPIFAVRCAVCHGEVLGLWPLDEYSHVVDWNVEIRGMVLDCTMPPVDSDVTMTLEERQLILEWLRCGFPR